MTALAGLIERTRDLAQDLAMSLSDTQIAEAARQGLAVYSKDAPRHVAEDFTGDGSAWQFEFTGPFVTRQSSIVRVEYPTGERPPCYLAANDWDIYIDVDGTPALILTSVTPSPSQTVRVTYSALHTIANLDGATATTIPAHHEHALVCLICAFTLQQAANRMTHEMEAPLFQGDVRERGDKAKSASARAEELRKVYQDLVGVSDGPAPAMAQVDWDTSYAGSGVDHLTHGSRWR